MSAPTEEDQLINTERLQQEARIVWLTDVGHMDYVRQSLVWSSRRRGRTATRGFIAVGYAELHPDVEGC